MRSEDDIITKAKLEIGGVWYETHVDTEGNGCNKCDLRKWCDENINLYKICRQFDRRMYFKKVDGKTLKDARFFHG